MNYKVSRYKLISLVVITYVFGLVFTLVLCNVFVKINLFGASKDVVKIVYDFITMDKKDHYVMFIPIIIGLSTAIYVFLCKYKNFRGSQRVNLMVNNLMDQTKACFIAFALVTLLAAIPIDFSYKFTFIVIFYAWLIILLPIYFTLVVLRKSYS